MPLRVSPFKCFCSDLTTTTGTRTTAAAVAAAATAMTTATTTTSAGASFAATATVTATTGKAAAAGGWVAGPQKDLNAKACMLVVRIPILPCGLTSSPSVLKEVYSLRSPSCTTFQDLLDIAQSGAIVQARCCQLAPLMDDVCILAVFHWTFLYPKPP